EPGVYEMGWVFNKEYWGKGLAYEACSALLNYGFAELGIHKVFAETVDGIKSVSLMQKLGMKCEGIQKSHTRDNNGKWCDVYLYGKLNEA
ncbi:MAG: GNAT family N-acetyltransferase, partial [Oscillospiraceae bacterium]|nr:GNAT family N-acetyltransferase [Oscillospiraceae bacterium]